MVLADTSVWIEFFKRKEPVFSELRELIEASEVKVHEVIFGELLQGCKNRSEERMIIDYWENLGEPESDASFIEAGRLSYSEKHLSKGVGLIDSVIISQARKLDCRIWTLDKKINNILHKSEIYRPKNTA
ncbi:MAG TPA: PIN domain-containing protein [Leptospiraceae bacterium]|nr:PIN domain-containing protein [Leptospiraceae bacterium]